MKKILFVCGFFIATPILFLFTVILLFLVVQTSQPQNSIFSKKQMVAYAALPTNENVFDAEITASGAKKEALMQFFQRYKSPLAEHTQLIIDTAEKYSLDYRLLPAIAMQESNLCAKSRKEAYNCWGFGITATNYLYFDSYEQGIETVSKALALRYRDKHNLVEPEDIEKMYTPSSKGKWASSVRYFMSALPSPEATDKADAEEPETKTSYAPEASLLASKDL